MVKDVMIVKSLQSMIQVITVSGTHLRISLVVKSLEHLIIRKIIFAKNAGLQKILTLVRKNFYSSLLSQIMIFMEIAIKAIEVLATSKIVICYKE